MSLTNTRQGVWWLATIPKNDWSPPATLSETLDFIRGQAERGAGGYEHWQIVFRTTNKSTRHRAKSILCPTAHVELIRSQAAIEYVWKDDTRIEGTQFELGHRAPRRNVSADWEHIWDNAVLGKLENVPSDIRVRCYNQLRRIGSDNLQPTRVLRTIMVYWGATGTGKSRLAWDEASDSAYSKDPRSKFWDGYSGQEHVVIDQFRGGIDIAHILRWTDRYPVRVEVKGSSMSLTAKKIWFTSNLNPRDWYPDIDAETKKALLRRLQITHFENPFEFVDREPKP
ncbi:hypothetical protein MT418_005621 [Batrachochytrium dendrobatidis]